MCMDWKREIFWLSIIGSVKDLRIIPDYLLTIQDLINHRAYPIDQIPARTRHAAAIVHMILNNLDPCVAQFPQELVTYGGNGQVFSNWAQVRYYAFWKRNKFKKRDFFSIVSFVCLYVCLFLLCVIRVYESIAAKWFYFGIHWQMFVNHLNFNFQFLLTMKYLSEMTEEQTLVMYSGHPAGLFPSSPSAPRVVVTNGMVWT